MNASIVTLLLTLFIATFTVTGILWMALYVTGQARMNVPHSEPVQADNDSDGESGNDGFIWS